MELAELKKLAIAQAEKRGHKFSNTNFQYRPAGQGWRVGGKAQKGVWNACINCGVKIYIAKIAHPRGDVICEYEEEDCVNDAAQVDCKKD